MATLDGDEGRLVRAQALSHEWQHDFHELLLGAIDEGLVDESLGEAGRFPVGVHQDFNTRSACV